MSAVERKWQMTRLCAGDYLLPSNDSTVMWRLSTHEDGSLYGLECSYEERTFWQLEWMLREDFDSYVERYGEVPGGGDGTLWHESAWGLATRKEAINLAMELDDRRLNPPPPPEPKPPRQRRAATD